MKKFETHDQKADFLMRHQNPLIKKAETKAASNIDTILNELGVTFPLVSPKIFQRSLRKTQVKGHSISSITDLITNLTEKPI